jgi:Putative lipoprotein LpqV
MVAALAVASAMTGCSAGEKKSPPSAVPPSGTAQVGPTAAPGVAVSPAGVTISINVPARSTEEEYFQACHAARTWMQGHPGVPEALVEKYLAAVQAPAAPVGAGTWNIAWAALPLARQAAVIVAARAAANDECG